MTEKPSILWLADFPGWAYDSIVRQNSRRLPQYTHSIYFMCGGHPQPKKVGTAEVIGPDSIGSSMETANVIVSMFLHYQEICKDKKKTVIMLTGLRPFE